MLDCIYKWHRMWALGCPAGHGAARRVRGYGGRRETGRVSERMWVGESGGLCLEIKAGTNQLT